MSLRARLLLGLTVPVVLFGAAVLAVQALILAPGFESLERETTARNLARAKHALEKDVGTLSNFCHDWAAWDDTHDFLVHGGRDFVDENLVPETFANGNFNACWIVGLDGRVAFGEARDPASNEVLELPELPAHAFPPGHLLLASRDPEVPVDGLLATAHGPMIVSAWPVTDSAKQAAVPGWIIMGRLLDQAHVDELVEQTRVPFVVLPVGTALEPRDARALARLQAGEPDVQADASPDLRHAWSLLSDLSGQPAFLLRIAWPREIARHGAAVLSFARLSLLAAAAVTLLALAFLLQRTVLGPVAELTAHVVRIGRGDDLAARLGSRRTDELGVLAREFDAMLGKLQASREELLQAARLGGRAEVASAVLHNVGNVLNSVAVSAAELRRHADRGVLAELERLEPLLREHEPDLARWLEQDPQGRRLPAYLAALAARAREERTSLRDENDRLGEGLGHVSALVRAQQEHAGVAGPAERVNLPGQVECALRLSEDGPGGPPIEVRREFEDVPEVLVPRHRVLEILVNLLRNARQSLQAAPVQARRLVVRVANRSGFVRVEVCDNGLGIAPENLARVFQPRFTTKSGGHGLGLHASANAARELGGSLTAHSEGEGRGATFVLELPLRAPGPEG